MFMIPNKLYDTDLKLLFKNLDRPHVASSFFLNYYTLYEQASVMQNYKENHYFFSRGFICAENVIL